MDTSLGRCLGVAHAGDVLCSNSWQGAGSAEEKLHVLCQEAAGDAEDGLHGNGIASLADDRFT